MRQNFRYSALDEAVVQLGSILAVENLPYHGILGGNLDESAKMTKLLLVALRVLPKLAYYMAAEKWRLEEMENSSGDLVESWWNKRYFLKSFTIN